MSMTRPVKFTDSAERIGRLLRASGMSKSDLARRLELSRPTVGAWLSGTARPSWKHIEKLGELFGVPSAQVAGLDADETTHDLSIHEAVEAVRKERNRAPKQDETERERPHRHSEAPRKTDELRDQITTTGPAKPTLSGRSPLVAAAIVREHKPLSSGAAIGVTSVA